MFTKTVIVFLCVLFIGCGVSKETVIVHQDVQDVQNDSEYGILLFVWRQDDGLVVVQDEILPIKKSSATITVLEHSGENKYRIKEGLLDVKVIDYRWAKDREDAREIAQQLLDKHSN